jgi:type IV secretory pathway VirB10-like protein
MVVAARLVYNHGNTQDWLGVSPMALSRTLFAILFTVTCAGTIAAQEVPTPQLTPGSERKPASESPETAQPAPPQTVALTVAKGSPLQVALDEEVRVKKVGQPVHARVVEPVYAFDRIVVPVGSVIIGEVTKIEAVSGGKRTAAALNADFTPRRKVEVGFHELALADGRRFSLHTSVTPGSGQVIELVTAANAKEKKNGVKDMASEKTREAKQQAHQEWDNAMKQLKTPGKIHRLERYGEAQLPVHREYIPAGTVYFAELEEPLDFGSEVMTVPMASSIGTTLPEGSVVRARLITPLSSATSRQGQDVEAVLSQPLMDGDRLILPQGSRLKGAVKQALPARRMKKNGQLRIAFTELVPPDGVEEKVVSTLVGVQAGKDANVKLDSEGGAEATTSKSRYLGTAISLGLAVMAASSGQDHDGDGGSNSGATGGLGGFKLVGLVVGAAARSRAFGTTMGAYGAAVSVYSHFIARGHEVVFPKNTAMEIGIGTRAAATPPTREDAPPSASSETAAPFGLHAYLQ